MKSLGREWRKMAACATLRLPAGGGGGERAGLTRPCAASPRSAHPPPGSPRMCDWYLSVATAVRFNSPRLGRLARSSFG